jgi:PHD/YefM family antitoxin component YafN of YafNO toxin-antitoxin module
MLGEDGAMAARRDQEPRRTGDEAIPTTPVDDPGAGLEGLMRMDVGTLEETLPRVLDAIARGPLVLTRNGGEFAVVLPLDAYRRLWARAEAAEAPRTVIEGEATRRD